MREKIKAFFGISKQEANGVLILLPLFFLFLALPFLTKAWLGEPPLSSEEVALLDSITDVWGEHRTSQEDLKNGKKRPASVPARKSFIPKDQQASRKKFPFDPNTLTKDSALLLGLEPVIAHRLIKYRKKGGHFYTKQDLKKIYGFSSSLYSALEPYIDLPETLDKNPKERTHTKPDRAAVTYTPFDINQADTSLLLKIRGIGPVLSKRIIKFRDKLGGFVNVSQYAEVYGLPPEVVERLKGRAFIAPDFQPKTLDINHASKGELLSHPYFSHSVAQSIVAFRWQHGPFQSPENLKKVHTIDETIYLKILPYIGF